MVDTNRFDAPITACHASFADKAALLNALWGTQHSPKALQTGEIDGGPYLEYYSQQCDIFCLEQSTYSPADGASGYEITTHQDILRIVERLATQSQDRQELSHCLWTSRPQPTKLENGESWPHPSQNSAPNHVIHNSIDWAARLLTMMEIGQPHCAFSARRPLVWSKASLRAFVANQLEPEKRDTGYVRLPKIFTARNLELLGGIKIAWTNNLADHLSLRDDDKTVLIFHHATFLENSHTDVFPPGFCQETLRTLSLLLPSSEKNTVKWYKKQRSLENLDDRAIRCPRLRADDRQIDTFHFWRERLVILKQVFDEAEPSTISQWWYDRRKGPQWYTFWVAVAVLVLTVVFGVIQSLEGAMQVYLALHHPDGPEGPEN